MFYPSCHTWSMIRDIFCAVAFSELDQRLMLPEITRKIKLGIKFSNKNKLNL